MSVVKVEQKVPVYSNIYEMTRDIKNRVFIFHTERGSEKRCKTLLFMYKIFEYNYQYIADQLSWVTLIREKALDNLKDKNCTEELAICLRRFLFKHNLANFCVHDSLGTHCLCKRRSMKFKHGHYMCQRHRKRMNKIKDKLNEVLCVNGIVEITYDYLLHK